jgi:hypothetical protein
LEERFSGRSLISTIEQRHSRPASPGWNTLQHGMLSGKAVGRRLERRLTCRANRNHQPAVRLINRFGFASNASSPMILTVAHEWEKYAKIKFKFVKSATAEIRISFYADSGSCSAVGRDALNQICFPLYPQVLCRCGCHRRTPGWLATPESLAYWL